MKTTVPSRCARNRCIVFSFPQHLKKPVHALILRSADQERLTRLAHLRAKPHSLQRQRRFEKLLQRIGEVWAEGAWKVVRHKFNGLVSARLTGRPGIAPRFRPTL